MTVPNAWPENLGSAADWANTTTGQADAGPVPYPRGRALGGSGAINAMAHVRGHRAVYDGWAAGGAAGWGFADLLPYFRGSERADGPRSGAARHRGPGPGGAGCRWARGIRSPRRSPRRCAGRGFPATDDLSGAVQEGVAWADLAIAGGERASPAEAYLRPVLGRPNLVSRPAAW